MVFSTSKTFSYIFLSFSDVLRNCRFILRSGLPERFLSTQSTVRCVAEGLAPRVEDLHFIDSDSKDTDDEALDSSRSVSVFVLLLLLPPPNFF